MTRPQEPLLTKDSAGMPRRDFLRLTVAASGGLLVGVYLPGIAKQVKAAQSFAPNAFVRIGTDESITIIANHSEMGQGVYTAIAMLVADELDADWSKVRVEAAPVDPVYNHVVYGAQITGGSTSSWSEYERLRKAGATARAMLVAAAADEWKADPTACRTENGQVIHTVSGRRLSYGHLAEKAAALTPPKTVALKVPEDFKIIGKREKRLDTPEKTNGKAIFGIDVKLPGMLVAVVARPPVFRGKMKSFNAEKAQAVPGVLHVLEIDRGIAVVASGFWPAKLGRDALEIVWDEGALAQLDSVRQREQYADMAKRPGAVARKEGDAASAMGRAARILEAGYELPYLAHAPMEPINCVADVRADGCDVWTGTQAQTMDHDAAMQITGLKPEQVKIHTTLLGGGFGRRAPLDQHFVREAVQISKAIKVPVKVIWTREDDTRGGYYRPSAYHAISGGLAADGSPLAWQQRIVCQSFAVGTMVESFVVKDGVDSNAVEGGADLPYEIPNLQVEWQMAPGGVPVHFWRSVGHSHTAFVVESFLDELAHAAGKDPFEYRRALLGKNTRHKRVLELAAEKADWGKPLQAGRGRGIAVHESFGSYVAQVAEASVSKEGKVRVHRVVCAVDCGPVINPDTILAQIESAVVFALSAALYCEITFERGRVQQRNFHDYPMLRINEMPEVESHIVVTTDKMGGIGEVGVPCVAPALANAIFAATGKRIRRLPIRMSEAVQVRA